jgi:hypothetical protein
MVVLPLSLVGAGTVASCSSTLAPGMLATGCSLNSDCNSPLVCVFGLCHAACAQSRDCPAGERCVSSSSGTNVCQLPAESTCSKSSPCATGLVCGMGMQCRNSCKSKGDCKVPGDLCEEDACYSPMEAAEAGLLDAGHDATVDGGSDTGADTSPPRDARHDSPAADAGCVVPEAGSPEAGPLGFVTSNFNGNALLYADGGPIPTTGGKDAGAIDWTGAPDIVVMTNCVSTTADLASCLPGVTPVTITIAKGPPTCEPACLADLYVLNSLTIPSGDSISLYSSPDTNPATNPIILAVRTTVKIQGALNLSAGAGTAGYGHFPGPGGYPFHTTTLGPGAGGNGETPTQYPDSDPGGAGFCGSGGKGGFTSGTESPGGGPYGTPTIIPLLGGSAGGLATGGNYPGAGGGGLQISAGSNISVTNVGVVAANGGGYYGGGGSGGAILLEAPSITIDGVVVANGGGGGSYFHPGAAYGQNGQLNNNSAVGYYDGR